MPTVTVPQAFETALQHHQAGRLGEAEAIYRQILAAEPGHAEALHHLGVIALQMGRRDLAVEWIRRAIVLRPDNPAAHSNLGEGYRAMGWLDEAIAAYREALRLKPDQPEAETNLGNALQERGQCEEALAAFHRALRIKPDYAMAHYNLGSALAEQGRLEEAAAAYRRAVALAPGHPEAHNNLGGVLTRQGQIDAALVAFGRALALRPDYAEAHNNLGVALARQGRIKEAIAAHRRALQGKPNLAEAHSNLGNALKDHGQLQEASAEYQRAIGIKPGDPEMHNRLGITLIELDRFDEAIAAYRRALALQPGYVEAWNNLGIALAGEDRLDEAVAAYRRAIALQPGRAEVHNNLGNALKDQGQLDEALATIRGALALQPEQAQMHSNLIYTLHFHPGEEGRAIAEEQRRWNRQFAAPRRGSIAPHPNDRDPERRLRIGYVSPDFRAHAVSFFLVPLMENHDHRVCEIYCYASVRRPDAVTRRLRNCADGWRDVRTFSDVELAARVRADGIDILVDLAMHTADHRLLTFARQPAPVQVSWLAYPGSTGVETIDYRLTDAYIDPPGEEGAGVGGRAVRLPDSWCCYAPIEDFPAVSPLPAARTGVVTFGSLNHFGKLHEGLLHCWARLLEVVPGARLLIVCPRGQARERLHAIFTAHGIAPERVELVARRAWPHYVRLFERIDIALDSYPCNGMTTTCHALWMGVPAVTLAGVSAVSRAGSSLLHTMGLPEWVARSEQDYIRIAAEGAADLPRLAKLRAALRTRLQASPLMDAPRFARNMEVAFRTMWRHWCAHK